MTMRRVMLCAMLFGCTSDTINGPGADDPVCSTWDLTTINGSSLPTAGVTSGSITLLCSNWYRLENSIEGSSGPMQFVGRYTETGSTIVFHGAVTHGPMTGTVNGVTLEVESIPVGLGSATYARGTP